MKSFNQGFIAITSVLILSAIFLSITISMASRAITVSSSSVAYSERDTARFVAHTCMEYALMELQRTLDYSGDESIDVEDHSCEIREITGSGISDRVVEVESVVGSHTYRLKDVIESVSPLMVITSSERVTHF